MDGFFLGLFWAIVYNLVLGFLIPPSSAMDVIPNQHPASVAHENPDFPLNIYNETIFAQEKSAFEDYKQTKHVFEQKFSVKRHRDHLDVPVKAKRARSESPDEKSAPWSTGDLAKFARLKRARSLSGIDETLGTDIFERHAKKPVLAPRNFGAFSRVQSTPQSGGLAQAANTPFDPAYAIGSRKTFTSSRRSVSGKIAKFNPRKRSFWTSNKLNHGHGRFTTPKSPIGSVWANPNIGAFNPSCKAHCSKFLFKQHCYVVSSTKYTHFLASISSLPLTFPRQAKFKLVCYPP